MPARVSAWRIRQVTSVSRSTFAGIERLAVVVDQEEPVAAPGDVADVPCPSPGTSTATSLASR